MMWFSSSNEKHAVRLWQVVWRRYEIGSKVKEDKGTLFLFVSDLIWLYVGRFQKSTTWLLAAAGLTDRIHYS